MRPEHADPQDPYEAPEPGAGTGAPDDARIPDTQVPDTQVPNIQVPDTQVADAIAAGPDDVAPLDTRIRVVVLQHPQEQDRALGTARLTVRQFRNAILKIGLSWPGLSKVLGGPADPHRWAVLYLGSAKATALAPGRDVVFLNRKGEAEADQNRIAREIEGVVLLDGNWSQAKALWWRNAWMLKCRRVILAPARPSRYDDLRREPRRDALSTIEAAGMLVSRLENRPEIEAMVMASFEKHLARFRAAGSSPPKT